MELKNQVTNLEFSRKMNDLGFNEPSLFEHVKIGRKFQGKESFRYTVKYCDEYPDEYDYIVKTIPAYTVAELGAMLLDGYKNFKRKGIWFCKYADDSGYNRCSKAKTEANARAKMLIYLKEKNLI